MNNNIKNKINVYDEEINTALLKLNNNNFNRNENNNSINDRSDFNKKITRPKSPKNNPNKNIVRNNISNNHIIISDKEENKNIELEKQKEKDNNNKIEIKQDESNQKKILRSHSQTPLDPLKQKNEQESPIKKPKEENLISNKNKIPEKPLKTKAIKKIRDIFEYSHVGFDGEQPKENNQDNYFIYKNFADHKDYIYMSVCDGHGIEGHFVSDFIKDALPYCMSENLKNTNILNEKELTHQIITETFLDVNNMLVSNENINSLFSGSTCVSVIYTPERLIVPNIGDSRAVLARYDKISKSYKAIDLSRDHKPTEKDESQRIYENDGRIQPFTEEGGEFVGPQRVWLKNEEVPGLAMTRSFGDRVAATVGVISEPEIKEFDFDENDKFMIIASDGIWEFISSQECVNIVKDFYEKNDLKGCADFLYEESSKRWLKEEEVIDDTTLILVFFD
jgi:serine/threonine protein phosphatase PrpC